MLTATEVAFTLAETWTELRLAATDELSARVTVDATVPKELAFAFAFTSVFLVVLAAGFFAPLVAVAAFAFGCCTTTQFPKPPAVLSETTQRFLFLPPWHFVPLGSLTEMVADVTVGGFYQHDDEISSSRGECAVNYVSVTLTLTPFLTIWAATNLLPVPVASTTTLSTCKEPSTPLQQNMSPRRITPQR